MGRDLFQGECRKVCRSKCSREWKRESLSPRSCFHSRRTRGRCFRRNGYVTHQEDQTRSHCTRCPGVRVHARQVPWTLQLVGHEAEKWGEVAWLGRSQEDAAREQAV